MVTELNKLADLMAQDSVPAWVVAKVKELKDTILAELRQNKPYVLHGPNGEEVVITPEKKKTATTA